MYEAVDFTTILQRMLNRVPSTIDKREGSIIYDALAPAAAELAQAYIALDVIMNETFADTANREYLVKRAEERGITPYPSTVAIVKGLFNCSVPLNSRFRLDTYHYKVIEVISEQEHSYKLVCETTGSKVNHKIGRLIPVEYIEGLQKAEITELLIPGEDEEETEHFRKRFLSSFNSQAYGGNIEDYKQKISALPGIGGVKVYPVWNGGGTVKLVIIDTEFTAPTSGLIESVQTEVDPVQNQGKGMGIAPIGHIVTVEGVTRKVVNIEIQAVYRTGWQWNDIRGYIESIIDQYFQELSKKWAESDTLIVRISQIESRILELEGILDISHTKLNGMEENLILGVNDVPVRGDISVAVS